MSDDANDIHEIHYYEPVQGHRLPHDPFNAIVGPRPIGWISSRDSDGHLNLAPYSFFNAFNYTPPIVGFASIGPCRDHDAADNWGEVHAIYLDPSAWNAGIGRALFSSAVSRLEALGYRHLTLWVLEGNARARAFYERAGWSASPAKKVEERPGFELREVRYERVVSQVE